VSLTAVVDVDGFLPVDRGLVQSTAEVVLDGHLFGVWRRPG